MTFIPRVQRQKNDSVGWFLRRLCSRYLHSNSELHLPTGGKSCNDMPHSRDPLQRAGRARHPNRKKEPQNGCEALAALSNLVFIIYPQEICDIGC